MTTTEANNVRKWTLRELVVPALEQPSQRGEDMLRAYDSAAAQAQMIDVSDLISYFWDDTSEDDSINIGDFPNVSINPDLAAALGGHLANVLFFEAAVPKIGFAAGMLADSSGDIGPYSVDELMRAAIDAGLPALTTLSSNPMVVFCENAMVERIGVMVIADSDPAQNADLYRQQGINDPGQLHQVLHILPFIRHDQRMDGRILLPQIIARLPVADTLRVRADSVRYLPFTVLGTEASPDTGLLAALAGSCIHSVLNSALFCLSVSNAVWPDGKARREGLAPRFHGLGSDAYGQCFKMTFGSLADKLSEQGPGDKPEIGHALTMCRDYFY